MVAPPPGYVPAGGKVVAPPPGYTPPDPAAPPPAKRQRTEDKEDEEDRKLRTVFLSNLDFEVDENKIVEIFGKYLIPIIR